jgi:hypothetical protein
MKAYLSMQMQPNEVTINGMRSKITLPKGCLGLMFVFESKETARDWHGKVVELTELVLHSRHSTRKESK